MPANSPPSLSSGRASINRIEGAAPRRAGDCAMAPARNTATRSGLGRSVSAGYEGTDRSLTMDDADRLDRPSEDGSIMELKPRRRAYPDWRDPSSHADTRHQTRDGWIWEVLRRNGAFVWAASALPIRGSLSRQRADWIEANGRRPRSVVGARLSAKRPITSPTLSHRRVFAERFNSLGGMVGEHTRLDHGCRREAPAREHWRPAPDVGARMSMGVGRGDS